MFQHLELFLIETKYLLTFIADINVRYKTIKTFPFLKRDCDKYILYDMKLRNNVNIITYSSRIS